MAKPAALPALAALRALEAVARLGSFRRAAEELHVSTSAVSHQVRSLEESLGTTLIDRSDNHRMVPTNAGTRLTTAVHHALGELTRACDEIRGDRKRQQRLIVSANAPFASLWLAPRLARFSARHPAITVSAVMRDEPPKLGRGGIDIAIVRVRGHTTGPNEHLLVQETVFPVCSPALLASEPSLATPAGLRRVRLLQEEHENSPEIDWHAWFALLKLGDAPISNIVHLGGFNLAISAAVAGAGVALGRSPLIDFDLESGRLVRLFPSFEYPGSWQFMMRMRPGAMQDRTIRTLAEFLLEEAKAQNPREISAAVSAVSPPPRGAAPTPNRRQQR